MFFLLFRLVLDIYTHMHVCILINMHPCVYISIYTHIYLKTCTSTHATHIRCLYMLAYILQYMHNHILIYILVHMNKHIDICVYQKYIYKTRYIQTRVFFVALFFARLAWFLRPDGIAVERQLFFYPCGSSTGSPRRRCPRIQTRGLAFKRLK